MTRAAGRSCPRGSAELRELVERIARVNPTGRGCRPAEERSRYEEKARLQSLLIEGHPEDVRVQAHEAMPGVVGLSVPRLRASAAHAVIEALSDRARAWVEEQLRAAAEAGPDLRAARAAGAPAPRGEARLIRAEELIGDYDFECAAAELTSLARDAGAAVEDRRRALLRLIEIHVDHLADDAAALALEEPLRALGPAPEAAHEMLGVAAARAGDAEVALRHLRRCGGERSAASLASLARACAEARAWGAAAGAWERLRALAAMAEPPLAAIVAGHREDARRCLASAAERSEGREIDADEDLARLVRDLAPAHPWLRERREAAQRSRSEACARALLDRAEACARDGDLAGVEHALGLLGRSAARGPGDAARIEALAAWAEERRVEALAARALELAAEGDAEAACRAYAALPDVARERVRRAGSSPLFQVLDELNTAVGDNLYSRPRARAAAAWIAALGAADPAQRRLLVAPHLAVLEAAPGLGAAAREILRAPESRPAAGGAPPRARAPAWQARIGGRCFTEVGEPAAGGEPLGVGEIAVRVGALSHVVTFEALAGGGAWQIGLWAPGGQPSSRWFRVEGEVGFLPGCLLTTGQRIGLADAAGQLWVLAVEPEPAVRRVDLGALWREGPITAVDENVLALGAGDSDPAGASLRLVDARTGAVVGDLAGPALHRTRTAQGSLFHRVSGASVERLDAAGRGLQRFDLPFGVSASAILESPLGASPMVLSEPIDRRAVMLWWQPEGRFCRAFELFDAIDHGAAIDAVTLPGRGLCVVTRRRGGAAFLHLVEARKGSLRPAYKAVEAPGHLGLVLDASGQRCWTVRRAGAAGIDVRPLRMRQDPA